MWEAGLVGHRLHIGASSLELIAKTSTKAFIDPTWIHLGDEPNFEGRSATGTLKSRIRATAKKILRESGAVSKEGSRELYGKTDFRAWVFNHGDLLPFADKTMTFIYSEHVMEHFRYDIALEIFKEANRVLVDGGVIRTVVPDSDYRTYEKPEYAGYPGRKLPMNHPNKHKTRWNVYILAKTLEAAGFESKPIIWCDETGSLQHADLSLCYEDNSVDSVLTRSLSYVQRPRSLIVDGIRRG